MSTATVRHVADADDCREPFDWSDHLTDDGSTECWCIPVVEETSEEVYDGVWMPAVTVLHSRPIEYDIATGEGRVESRWP